MIWDKMRLQVDQPRPRGADSSNDSNTARRAFQGEKTFSALTGVSEELIRRLHVILQVMACGRGIKPAEFRRYCDRTAELFVTEYVWYYISVSVHKVAEIMQIKIG